MLFEWSIIVKLSCKLFIRKECVMCIFQYNSIVTTVFINIKQMSESVTGFKRYTTNVVARQLKINNRLSNAIPKTNNYPLLQQSRQCTLVIVNNVCSHKCYTRTCVFYTYKQFPSPNAFCAADDY